MGKPKSDKLNMARSATICKCGAKKSIQAKICRECFKSAAQTKVSTKVFLVDGERCRWISLTRGQKCIVSEHRYEGLSRYTWYAQPRKNPGQFYAITSVPGPYGRTTTLYMHRAITCSDSANVDHRNGNTLDNRDSNLRPCTVAQNCRNSAPRKNCSGRKGVVSSGYPDKKWRAIIYADGRRIFLGGFYSVDEAARAYDTAARYFFGEFARTNFPD